MEITARRAEGGEVLSVCAVRGKPGWLGGRGIDRISGDAVDAIVSERREGAAVLEVMSLTTLVAILPGRREGAAVLSG